MPDHSVMIHRWFDHATIRSAAETGIRKGDCLMSEDCHEAPVLLFDGVCHLCNGAVDFVLRHEQEHSFRFAPLQSEAARRLFARYSLPADSMDTLIVVEHGCVYQKSDAVIRVARRLRLPWRAVQWIKWTPVALRDFAYDLLARYRYTFFGRLTECRIPQASLKHRFLDV